MSKHILIMLFLFGCATSSLNYTAPSVSSLESSSVESKMNLKDTWARVIEKLSEHSFVINNIDRDSGLINFTFEASPAEQYADCGNFKGFYKNIKGLEEYDFNAAKAVNFKYQDKGKEAQTNRTTKLTGRTNIFIKKISKTNSLVRVSSSFILSIHDAITYYDNGQYLSASNSNEVKFSSVKKGRNAKGKVECISNREFENSILRTVL